MARPAQPTPRNRLLAALPPDDRARLWPRLERVDLATRQVVHASGEPIAFVLFPETGWCSNLVSLEDGDAGEVGLIGREGLVGLPLVYGDDRSSVENMVQAPGTALRLGAGAFRAALDESPVLRALLLRYALASRRRWRRPPPATAATRSSSASRAGCSWPTTGPRATPSR